MLHVPTYLNVRCRRRLVKEPRFRRVFKVFRSCVCSACLLINSRVAQAAIDRGFSVLHECQEWCARRKQLSAAFVALATSVRFALVFAQDRLTND